MIFNIFLLVTNYFDIHWLEHDFASTTYRTILNTLMHVRGLIDSWTKIINKHLVTGCFDNMVFCDIISSFFTTDSLIVSKAKRGHSNGRSESQNFISIKELISKFDVFVT